jgi:CIC family chloride channel protein
MRLDLQTARTWGLYVLVGAVAGLGSVIFYLLCQAGIWLFLGGTAGYYPPAPGGEPPLFEPLPTLARWWLLPLVVAAGGLLGALIVYRFAPEAEGHGTDAAIEAFHQGEGYVRPQVVPVKILASFLTLGSGGSGGREGPIAQIGAGFGSFLGTVLKLPVRERRILLAAGVGAGIGSIFRAPLAGTLFAAEVLYGSLEFDSDVILPAAIATTVSYCVFSFVFGWGSLFKAPDFRFEHPLELIPYTAMVPVLTAAAFLYVRTFYGLHRRFKQMRLSPYLRPALGGLAVGLIGIFLPQTLAFGYGFIQQALQGNVATGLLLAVALGKILTTSLSIGSGGSGGVFGPSMVIGAALGGACGNLFHQALPNLVSQPGAFVIVGMAGFWAAASKSPISTILMVSEMTGSYHLLLPALLVCSLSFLFSRGWSIYDQQVPGRLESPAHAGDFFFDVLGELTVADVGELRQVRAVPENMSFAEFRSFFAETEQHYFPVVDEQRRLSGIFSINDVRSLLFEQGLDQVVVVKDLARADIIKVTPSEDLASVLKKFTVRNLNELPVVDAGDQRKLLGMLGRRQVIALYNRRLAEIKASRQMGVTG